MRRFFFIQIEQKQFYKKECKALKNTGSINKDFSLFSYMPYLHKNGLLRLGGRLVFSDFLINEKLPIILPKNSWLITLIVRKERCNVMR